MADAIDSTKNDYKDSTDSQQRGVAARKKAMYPFAGGKFHTMFFTPNSPLFRTGKLLVPMQEVSIKIYLNDPSIFMVSPAATDGTATKAKVLADSDL